jgi:hypothetical protein
VVGENPAERVAVSSSQSAAETNDSNDSHGTLHPAAAAADADAAAADIPP